MVGGKELLGRRLHDPLRLLLATCHLLPATHPPLLTRHYSPATTHPLQAHSGLFTEAQSGAGFQRPLLVIMERTALSPARLRWRLVIAICRGLGLGQSGRGCGSPGSGKGLVGGWKGGGGGSNLSEIEGCWEVVTIGKGGRGCGSPGSGKRLQVASF